MQMQIASEWNWHVDRHPGDVGTVKGLNVYNIKSYGIA